MHQLITYMISILLIGAISLASISFIDTNKVSVNDNLSYVVNSYEATKLAYSLAPDGSLDTPEYLQSFGGWPKDTSGYNWSFINNNGVYYMCLSGQWDEDMRHVWNLLKARYNISRLYLKETLTENEKLVFAQENNNVFISKLNCSDVGDLSNKNFDIDEIFYIHLKL